jgi:hypothetical protein
MRGFTKGRYAYMTNMMMSILTNMMIMGSWVIAVCNYPCVRRELRSVYFP